MVKEVQKNRNIYFQCDKCKFIYKDKVLAKKCEAYCKKYNACSLDITKHSIEI